MELTQEMIDEINKNSPYDQGIFKEGNGVPLHVKELVVYSRYESGGYSGGDCWGGVAKRYDNEAPKDHMMVLDLVLAKLRPKATFLEYRSITRLIENNRDSGSDYYGNSTEWMVEYIPLSKLYELLEKFDEGE